MARPPTARPAEKALNVLVIILDTVRRDSFHRPTGSSLTPRIDRIMARAVRFENAWSTSSWSLPAQVSILTGRYPHEHGADWPALRLDDRYPTFAEVLAARGYVTGAFSGNISWATPEYLGRGFHRFKVYQLGNLFRRTTFGSSLRRALMKIGLDAADRGKKEPALNEDLVSFLDDYGARPFFAFLCYMDVNQEFHTRNLKRGFWEPRPPMAEIVKAYEQGLRRLDTHLAALLDELERRGSLKNTIVVITSDHGESFGAANAEDHNPSGHGSSLYAEQTRVPLFVILPAGPVKGETVGQAVTTRDIAATIASALELRDAPFGGKPLPLAASRTDGGGSPVLITLRYGDRHMRSVVWSQWQYIRNFADSTKREELYDYIRDPVEQQNLAGTAAARPTVERLSALITATMSRTNAAATPVVR